MQTRQVPTVLLSSNKTRFTCVLSNYEMEKNKHQGTSTNRSFGHWIKYKIDKHWKKKYFYGIMYLSSAISEDKILHLTYFES